MFAKPGDGALVLLALIAAFSLVKGVTELVVAIGGARIMKRTFTPYRGDHIDPSSCAGGHDRPPHPGGQRCQIRHNTHPNSPGPPGRGAGESTFDRAKPIALGLMLAVLAVAGLRVLAELEHVLILVFLAVLVASAVSRPAAALERRGVPRGAAVALVQLAATVVMMVLVWIVVPPLVSQLHLFAQDAPSYVTRFHRLRNEYVSIKRQYPEAGRSTRRCRQWPRGWRAVWAAGWSTCRSAPRRCCST